MNHPHPYLNLGCGKIHLPALRPAHHVLVDSTIYDYPYWLNIDHSTNVGADMNFDLFTYPWPLPSDSYDGALLAHIVEHIPHPIRAFDYNVSLPNRADELRQLPDGFYAFFSELHRVLRHGAVAHVLCPYGLSVGAMQDPTHTRFIVANTFSYLYADPNAPFDKSYGSTWEAVKPCILYPTELGARLQGVMLNTEMMFNTYQDIYAPLRVVKD